MTYDPMWEIREQESASQRIQERGVPAALENLRHNFATMDEYKSPGFILDRTLLEKDINHPLASPHRFIRIGAADYLREKANESELLVDEELLEQLHASLFDCVASVRVSVARTIEAIGHPSSLPFLENLVEKETDSAMVRRAAVGAIKACQRDE